MFGTCEAYCPSTNAFLVVFDDPFESLQALKDTTRQRKGISVAVLDTEDYLVYEDWPYAANQGFGGTTLVKTSKSKQLQCAWYGKWIPAAEFSKKTRPEKDEPLLCLCRRLETAEPPPPNTDTATGGGAGEEGEQEVYQASKLIECEKCGEWFHSECVERICKLPPHESEPFTCPVCTQVLLPPGYRPLPVAQSGVLSVPKQRKAKWLEHTAQQSFWQTNSLLEWQYWTRVNSEVGSWVVCLATFRRLVGCKFRKHQQQALLAAAAPPNPDQVRGLNRLLAWPLPRPSNSSSSSSSSSSSMHAFMLAHFPQPVAAPVLAPTPPVVREGATDVVSPCTRLRTFDEHQLFARTKRHKMKSHVASSIVINSSIENLSSFGKKRHLRFSKSLIEGWGVFTEEFIPAGDFVIEYKGEIVTKPEAEIRFAKYTALGLPDYLFTMDQTAICDATMRGSMARFVNHSCDPNCYSTIVFHAGRKRIGIFALRDIKVGEELCYDYKFQEDLDPNNKLKCNCGSSNCKGVLN